MNKIRRINFYGGPGCSKSTLATGIFSELKKSGLNIEYVNEYIKTWAHQGKIPKDFDQLYIFGKQLYKESRILPHVDYIISDSPVLLNIAYAKKYACSYADQCLQIALQYEKQYPGLHIFLDRTGLPYDVEGRYENLEEAQIMDGYIEMLIDGYVEYETFSSLEQHKILQYIKDRLL